MASNVSNEVHQFEEALEVFDQRCGHAARARVRDYIFANQVSGWVRVCVSVCLCVCVRVCVCVCLMSLLISHALRPL